MLLCVSFSQAQTLDELKSMQDEKNAIAADLQSQADAAKAEADGLQSQIDILSGWRKGLGGILGFDWSRANKWASGSGPDVPLGTNSSTGLGADISGHLLRDTEKAFWHNKLKIVENYKDIDLAGDNDDDGLFDRPITDLLNISSLAGYKITEKLAISAQGELNTSLLKNFLKPGTIDIGVGVTWLPIENMTVMIHPFNYNYVIYRGLDDASSGALGAKVRVDYFRDFAISGKPIHWDTNLTAFIPYGSAAEGELGNQYWQWLNNLTFEVWRGIGVGVGWGLRKADFEAISIDGGEIGSDVQSYTTLGLSYTL